MDIMEMLPGAPHAVRDYSLYYTLSVARVLYI
jgi:hypothetical protein